MKCDKTKICCITGDMGRGGGTERMVQLLCNAFVEKSNYKVSIISFGPNEKIIYPLNQEIEFIKVYKQQSIKVLRMLRIIINNILVLMKTRTIRNIICSDSSLIIYLILTKMLRHNVNLIIWDQFSSLDTAGIKRINFSRKLSLKLCNKYVVLTKNNLDSIVKKYGFKEKCVSIANICAYEKSKTAYNSESTRIISIGNLFDVKGFDMAILVAKQVLKCYEGWEWHIYGEGCERDKLQKLIEKNNLSSKVFLDGRADNISDIYSEASFLIMTSRLEAFGLVLIEAQAFHLPVVAFDAPYGPQTIINNGINGFLIKLGDIDSMAQKICELIDNKSLRQYLSNHATDNLSRYSASHISKEWEKLLV